MGFNRLLGLSNEEAAELVSRYWSQRSRFLRELHEKAKAGGFDLPTSEEGYLPKDLAPLGRFLHDVLVVTPRKVGFPDVPEWLAELHDPFSDNRGLTNDQVWLGLSVSYAFADALLKTVKGAKLTYGDYGVERYAFQNQPVIKGKWNESGNVDDVGCAGVGLGCVRGVKFGTLYAGRLIDAYRTTVSYAKRQGWVREEGW